MAQGQYGGGSEDIGGLRERLKSKKLTDDDIRRIDGLLAKEAGEAESIGGKRIVARLPHGMDVVK